VVGAMSVVTHQFSEPAVIIAGNPARIVRRNIAWVRNPTYLDPASPFHASYHEHMMQFFGDEPIHPHLDKP
jgi:serine acetyltransferase